MSAPHELPSNPRGVTVEVLNEDGSRDVMTFPRMSYFAAMLIGGVDWTARSMLPVASLLPDVVPQFVGCFADSTSHYPATAEVSR